MGYFTVCRVTAMKLIVLVTLLAIQVSCGGNIKQMFCNTTGIFRRPVCRIKSISSIKQNLTLGVETTKQIDELFFNIEVSSKMTSYWNRFIKVSQIEVCSFFRMANSTTELSLVQELYKEYKKALPNLPQTCPIQPGKYLENNRSITIYGHINLPNNPMMTKFDLPNGSFKFEFMVFTKNLSSVYRFGAIIEVQNQRDEKI